MTNQREAKIELSPEQVEILRVLYPLFKDEVFCRREHLVLLSTAHNGFLVLLLVIVVFVSPDATIDSTRRWLTLSSLVLSSGFHAYEILPQADRHRQAKSQLIEFETMMRLYQEGRNIIGKARYPKNGQTD